jgi:predicted histidine transporter YuiF (NhaC family)
MTIIFENGNEVIVHALEKSISYASDNQYIFLARSIWWIALIIGLHYGLVIHLDNLRKYQEVKEQQALSGEETPVDHIIPN